MTRRSLWRSSTSTSILPISLFSVLNNWTNPSLTNCFAYLVLPELGKARLQKAINKFIQGEKVTTTSKKFYKYVNEATNTNLYHYTNDSFAKATDIQWDKLLQSLYSIQHSAGRHFIIVEGHRLFECEDLLDMADYIIVLTATSATLQARPDPRPPLSLQLY